MPWSGMHTFHQIALLELGSSMLMAACPRWASSMETSKESQLDWVDRGH